MMPKKSDVPLTSSRTIAVNGEMVTRLRTNKGWTIEDLAGRSDCSTKTIENAEGSRALYPATLNRIATALGTELSHLRADANLPTRPRVVVNATFTFTFDQFDESLQLQNLLIGIARQIGAVADIEFGGAENGSVILSLSFTWHDSMSLLREFIRGTLRAFSIRVLILSPPDEFWETFVAEVAPFVGSYASSSTAPFIVRYSYDTKSVDCIYSEVPSPPANDPLPPSRNLQSFIVDPD